MAAPNSRIEKLIEKTSKILYCEIVLGIGEERAMNQAIVPDEQVINEPEYKKIKTIVSNAMYDCDDPTGIRKD